MSKITLTDKWIHWLKNNRLVAVLIILTTALALLIPVLKQSKEFFSSLLPTRKLQMNFSINNKLHINVNLQAWCDISITDKSRDVNITYPNISPDLTDMQHTDGGKYIVMSGDTKNFKISIPINSGLDELYTRGSGSIQIIFSDSNHHFLYSSTLRFSPNLSKINVFKIDLNGKE